MKRIRHLIAVALLATTASAGAITPAVVPSRTSGVAPLAVFFDATGTTSTGTTRPFHELGYQWNFNDAPATWAITGASKNLASGGVAAHVFESPGTYPVTLTVTDGVNNVTATVTITVSDPNTVFPGASTICVSATALPVAGVGGCPGGATVKLSGDWPTIVNTYAQPGKRVLLKRGEVYSGPATAVLNKTGPGIIGAYGVGAKPVIRTTGTTAQSNILKLPSNGGTSADWRLMDLDIDGQSALNRNFLNAASNYTLSRLLLLRIDAHDLGGGLQISAGPATPVLADQIFLVDSTIKRINTDTTGISQGTFWQGRRLGVLGNVIEDTTLGAAQHLIRVQHADRAVFSHNLLRKAHSGKEMFALRASCSDGTCGPFGVGGATQFVVLSRNNIETNTYMGIQADTAAISNSSNSIVRDLLFEGNWFATQPGGGPCIRIRAARVSVKNNVCDLSLQTGYIGTGIEVYGPPAVTGAALGSSDVWLYNNTIYSGGPQSNMIVALLKAPPVNNLVIRNNLVYGVKSVISYVATGTSGSTVVQGTNGTTNPSFAVVPVTQPSDLRLTSGSYALGTGAAVPVFTDFFGQPRQFGSALDKGAIIPH